MDDTRIFSETPAADSVAARRELVVYARRLLGTSADAAEDVVQDAYVHLVSRTVAGDPPEHVRAWLYAVVRSRCRDEIVRQRRWLIINAVFIAAFSAAGYWWAWFALWMLPRATWFQLVTRLRNIAEHALVAKNEPDPLRHARTTHANLVERALIAPYFVNYHCEHHMFMHVPCWNLPRIRRMLDERGMLPKMEGAPGYPSVLKAAAGAG